MCAEIHGFISRCLKIRVCGFLFTLTLEGFFVIGDICIYLHMQTLASIIQKEMFMLAVHKALALTFESLLQGKMMKDLTCDLQLLTEQLQAVQKSAYFG